jgi:carboxymethylenebutenolidase
MTTVNRSIHTELAAVGGATSYLARPIATAKAGLVLIPTVAGVDDFARAYTDGLADLGYATLAWNPYPGTRETLPTEEARERVAALNDRDCLDHLTTCIDYLRATCGVTNVGTVGFCFGGRFVLLLAAHDRRISAASAVYPSLPSPRFPYHAEDPVARASEIACPLQLVYPGRDHVTSRETFGALVTQLERRTAPTTVVEFPEAGHGFMHRPSPENDAATRASRPQIAGFLDAFLATS